jgi:general secretion pathway protein K
LYSRVAPLITVYSGVPGINEQVATRDVLRALPNVSESQIDDYVARRDSARANRQPIPTFPQNLFRSASNNFTPTRIRTDVQFADGNRFVREVVVRRYNDAKRPYAFLSWKEGRDLISASDLDPTIANSTNTAAQSAVSPQKLP